MEEHDLGASHETRQDPIEIRQDASITIQEALIIAAEEQFPIGKSTLQRWAKSWGDKGAASSVKAVLVTTRAGASYRLDRDDFNAWIFEQKQNVGSGETLRDPERSHETPRDPVRSHETSEDPVRSHETSRDANESESKLRDENFNLRIDIEVRKQLLTRAGEEVTRQRDQIEALLRENGGLQTQVLQLSAPRGESATLPPHIHASQPIENGEVDIPQ